MKIFTFSGKAESGKDTTALLLKELLEEQNKKVLILHYADLVKYFAKQYFNWDGNKDEKGRTLLQWIGTEKVRSRFPDFWVNQIISFINIFENDFDYFLIGDVRFVNEIENLRNNLFDVISIKVERANHENKLTKEQRLHPSETALDDFTFDVIIHNDGDLIDLRMMVKSIKEMVL